MSAALLKKMRDMGLTMEQAIELMEAWEAGSAKPVPELSKGALRTRKWRQKQGERHGDVTVTHHGDVSLTCEGAQVNSPSSSLRSEDIPPEKPSVSTPKGGEKRGSRLPEGFNPDLAVAEALGLTLADAAVQADKFLDYWRAVPGAKGRKLDWPATWRNWCRTAADNLSRRAPHGQPSHHDAKFDARQANLARHERGADIAARQPRWEP